MTAEWDTIQAFLTKIGELKDSEYYRDALRMVRDVIDDIHEIDHKMDQKIANTLFRSSRSYKDIQEFMRKSRHD